MEPPTGAENVFLLTKRIDNGRETCFMESTTLTKNLKIICKKYIYYGLSSLKTRHLSLYSDVLYKPTTQSKDK